MSRSTIASFAIVILLLIAGGYYWYSNMAVPAPEEQATNTPAAPETGDASLTQTAAAIEALVDALAADEAGVSESLADEPLKQTY
jgi:hypothetical protein